MKAVNSISCDVITPELTLVKSSSLPVIPSVHFVVTKGDESMEFQSFKAIESWIIDECDKELYEAYQWADSDDTRGCSDMNEWIHYCLSADQLFEYAEDKGWTIERVAV